MDLRPGGCDAAVHPSEAPARPLPDPAAHPLQPRTPVTFQIYCGEESLPTGGPRRDGAAAAADRTWLKEKHDTHDRRSRRSDTPPPPLSSEEGGEEETGEKLNGYPRTPGCVRTGGEGGGVTREERADELKRTQ